MKASSSFFLGCGVYEPGAASNLPWTTGAGTDVADAGCVRGIIGAMVETCAAISASTLPEALANERWDPPVMRPGVEAKTVYSSAKVGVQPVRFSRFVEYLGVSGKCAVVGVWPGVGGCAPRGWAKLWM